ncbi:MULTISPECIES: LysR substrate-binding domain-containing protein [unclassified Methylobacterium]|uniref:LysR substrate-binding domain-containing protein n=1 Tax=unclassified Methylobacterium TaxID=2615210 RepID=UPI0006FA76B6|nr:MULTISPECIES: LysR substrate-binding domain-containing protein [unclassified Methylobacterium]KQO73658.1 LysR family transcriptional regulator [Methylobacterium sp. Leaf89]KQO78817.1 LysR family transcriptional regulator [Methylobacterium sp. Leaf88]KQP67544.1 LysR family transcriptional regulator [Methylobacterium sp. Leaf111]KQU27334.1 LysR family transcriptional regulator [Methylobacterium sp. Leaf94]
MLAPTLLRRLDPTTLRLFVAMCEDGTLTQAARRAAIAPSAVSKRLVELEQSLGVQLMTRQARGMVMTPAGETLLHHARRMLHDVEQIVVELAEHAKGVRGIVRMFANLSAIVQFLPEDLRAFLARQEAIKISLEERPSGGVVAGVEAGLAELGICSGSIPARDLTSVLYRRDSLVVVMRHDHPLADRPALAFRDTLDHDFVGLHAESSIYASVRGEAQSIGRPLRLRVHVPGFDAVLRMAQADMGLGVVPLGVFALLGSAMDLAAIPLTDPWAQRELRIVSRPGERSPAASLLVASLTADAA